MCISCGCGEPNEAHGDPRNLTAENLEFQAEQAGVSVERIIQTLTPETIRQAAATGGVSTDDVRASLAKHFLGAEEEPEPEPDLEVEEEEPAEHQDGAVGAVPLATDTIPTVGESRPGWG